MTHSAARLDKGAHEALQKGKKGIPMMETIMTPEGMVSIDISKYPEFGALFTRNDLGLASALPNVNCPPEANEGGKFVFDDAQTPEQFFQTIQSLMSA